MIQLHFPFENIQLLVLLIFFFILFNPRMGTNYVTKKKKLSVVLIFNGNNPNEKQWSKKSIGLEVRFAKKKKRNVPRNGRNGSFLLIASNGYYTLRSHETNKNKKKNNGCLKWNDFRVKIQMKIPLRFVLLLCSGSSRQKYIAKIVWIKYKCV